MNHISSTPEVQRANRAAVREAVRSEYPYWQTYVDPRVGGQRMKMMQNGADLGAAYYKRAGAKIKAKLDAAKVPYKSAGFEELYRHGYGPYTAYVVQL
jgi:hypothetical protein